MAKVEIRDDSIWFKHIKGDTALQERLEALPEGQTVDLEVAGIVGKWERMRVGRDGRPTRGIKPADTMKDAWRKLQNDRGRVVDLREVGPADTYLAALVPLLSEWDSAEDEEACRGL